MEGFLVFEGVCDGFGDRGGDLDASVGFVVGDLDIEGVERLTLDLERGVAEGLGEIRDPSESFGERVVLFVGGVGRAQFGEGGGEGFVLGAEFFDVRRCVGPGSARRGSAACLHGCTSFSRDCLEVTIDLGDSKPLHLFINHLKSQFIDYQTASTQRSASAR